DLGNKRALRALHAEALNKRGGKLLDFSTEPSARDMTGAFEMGNHRLGGFCRNGEADADRSSRYRVNRGRYTDELPIEIEARAAGIALIDRCVDLDEVVVRVGVDVASLRRDYTGRYSFTQAEGVANDHDPIADPGRLVGECDKRKVVAISDFEERQVGLLVRAHDLGGIGLAVVCSDLNRARVVDDVIIGHRITIG